MRRAKVLTILSMALLLILTSTTPRVLARSERGAAVPIDQLPEGLKGLDIRDYFIESDFKRVGVIHALRGTVVVVHKATKEAYFGVEGDYIYENDSLETLPRSRCRIKLFNEDVISMAAGTHLEVDEVVFKREEREKRSFLSMLKGKAMFYSLRLFSFKQMFTKLETPTAVVGVRGTKFAVHVYKKDERKIALGEIRLAHSGDSIPYLAALEGEETGTDVIFYDGTGDVDGVEVGPGEKYEDGIIKGATEEEMQAFEEDTSVEEEEVRPEEEVEVPPDTGEPGPESDPETTEKIASKVSQEGGGGAEQSYTAPSPQLGYFSALLSGICTESGSYDYASTYRSLTRQDFGTLAAAGTVEGYNRNNEKMVATGQGAWEELIPYLTLVEYSGGSSGDLGTNYPITHGELGHNDYLEWGWWYVTASFPIASDYAVYYPDSPRQGYYIFGPNPADIGALSSKYLYSGTAYGTFYDASASANKAMGYDKTKGWFKCILDFGSSVLEDFEMNVAGGGYHAYIYVPSGSLTAGDNHISLDYTSGYWQLGPTGSEVDATYGDVKGSVYGSGSAVGGVWNMGKDLSYYYATGVFEGSNPSTPPTESTTDRYGYFTAILNQYEYGGYAQTYNSTARQDFNGASVSGYSEVDEEMRTSGSGGWVEGANDTYLRYVKLGTAETIDLGTGNPITHSELGHTNYLAWGYWHVDESFPVGEVDYYVHHPDTDRQAYYIFGPNPTDIGAMSGRYNYSGTGCGTLHYPAGSTGSVEMTGSFETTVNFETKSITNFSLNVSDAGNQWVAKITGASGDITPGDNHISLNKDRGTWQIGSQGEPGTATYGDAKGSFYGKHAEAVGGVWKMGDSDSGYDAAGIFEGSKQ